MSFRTQDLLNLFPALYRIRDAKTPADRPGPLESLLSVFAEQIGVLDEDLRQYYDNLFIETAAGWAVPYIGDLIGYRTIRGAAPRAGGARAQVANTIGLRRRKGTAPVLEQLARSVTGWDARAVEFFQLLATSQHMNHVRPNNPFGPDVREWRPLEELNGPFETTPHVVDVRRIDKLEGNYNISNVGIFLFRLAAYRLSDATPWKLDDRRYLFNPLGISTPLWTHPQTESSDEIEHLAERIDVAAPISRRVLKAEPELYYGNEKSLLIKVGTGGGVEVPADQIAICNLSDLPSGGWAHLPAGRVAVDPVLGRIVFPSDLPPPDSVRVTFHYGGVDNLGGGEYDRAASIDPLVTNVVPVSSGGALQAAIDQVRAGGVTEITDSSSYRQPVAINADADARVELRAADGARPTLSLGRDLTLAGAADAEVVLNGLVISGAAVRTAADAGNRLKRVRLMHCTLVPGIVLTREQAPTHPGQPGLIIDLPNVEVIIDRCVLGAVRVHADSSLRISNSIIDANSPAGVAIAGSNAVRGPAGSLRIENCTVIGKVHARVLTMASDSIFRSELGVDDGWIAPVLAERKQEGCVRFCYVPPGSRVPRRYRCQPDLELDAKARELGLKSAHDLEDRVELRPTADAVSALLEPRFTSTRFGDPAYGQLGRRCHPGVTRGAHDESEMGAFHDLQQAARETDLRVRLCEYMRFGLEAGIFYVT